MPPASRLRAALVVTVLIPITLAGTSSGASAAGTRLTNDEFEDRTIYWINQYRVDRGLPRVRDGGCLDSFAEKWAWKMRGSDRLYHQNLYKILDQCSSLTWVGEVMARGSETSDPKHWVDAWMASDEHRAVIMKPRADRIGMGVRVGADGRRVLVGDLGDLS